MVRADAEVEVVLERHADQVGHGVLGDFGELLLAEAALLLGVLGLPTAPAPGGLVGEREGQRAIEARLSLRAGGGYAQRAKEGGGEEYLSGGRFHGYGFVSAVLNVLRW